jgi:hypothetical protein
MDGRGSTADLQPWRAEHVAQEAKVSAMAASGREQKEKKWSREGRYLGLGWGIFWAPWLGAGRSKTPAGDGGLVAGVGGGRRRRGRRATGANRDVAPWRKKTLRAASWNGEREQRRPAGAQGVWTPWLLAELPAMGSREEGTCAMGSGHRASSQGSKGADQEPAGERCHKGGSHERPLLRGEGADALVFNRVGEGGKRRAGLGG